MADYEFFKTDYRFYGKHARMVSEIWALNDYEHTYFKRLIDVYIAAAVLGFRLDRTAEVDYSPVEPKSIFMQQMVGAKEELDFIMQMMLMLEDAGKISNEQCIRKAFKGAETKEEFEQYNAMFDAYVLGGVEELYERLILQKEETDMIYADDKTAELMMLFDRFAGKKL